MKEQTTVFQNKVFYVVFNSYKDKYTEWELEELLKNGIKKENKCIY